VGEVIDRRRFAIGLLGAVDDCEEKPELTAEIAEHTELRELCVLRNALRFNVIT